MSDQHYGGNTIPEITREEHQGDLNAKREVPIDVVPTHVTKLNPSVVLTYDGFGNPTKVEKTIDGTTYTKTLTWTGSNLTDVSVWT